jgi:hypothetical protein
MIVCVKGRTSKGVGIVPSSNCGPVICKTSPVVAGHLVAPIHETGANPGFAVQLEVTATARLLLLFTPYDTPPISTSKYPSDELDAHVPMRHGGK